LSRRILVRDAALADLEAITLFLSSTSPRAALSFSGGVDGALRRIADHPGIGRSRPSRDPLLQGIRTWPLPGFESVLVVYRVARTDIEVLRVLHGARDVRGLLSDPDA
jgi:toxin ParE1/3/4